MIRDGDDHDPLICFMCGEPTHIKPWVAEGPNAWWLIDRHAIAGLFDSGEDAVVFAKEHELEIKRWTP